MRDEEKSQNVRRESLCVHLLRTCRQDLPRSRKVAAREHRIKGPAGGTKGRFVVTWATRLESCTLHASLGFYSWGVEAAAGADAFGTAWISSILTGVESMTLQRAVSTASWSRMEKENEVPSSGMTAENRRRW